MSIDIEYHSFSPERADKLWKNFKQDVDHFKKTGNPGVLPDSMVECLDPEYSKNATEQDMLWALQDTDLEYGSVSCWPLDSGKMEYFVVQALAEAVGLTFENEYRGYLEKDELINIFENIKFDKYKKAIDILAKDVKWDAGESEDVIYEYLEKVRPVALDLKQNPETLFVNEVNDEFSPDSVGELLKQRAKEHYKIFQSLS